MRFLSAAWATRGRRRSILTHVNTADKYLLIRRPSLPGEHHAGDWAMDGVHVRGRILDGAHYRVGELFMGRGQRGHRYLVITHEALRTTHIIFLKIESAKINEYIPFIVWLHI